MLYFDYKVSRNLAWEILIREQVTSLPVRIVPLCRQMGIRVVLHNDPKLGDGYCGMIGGKPHIFVCEGCYRPRQRFTAAHELGHILLGHAGKYELVNREPSATDNPIEQAANVFASRLLAPACVLWACNAFTPEAIADLCDISMQAAAFRAERMGLLRKRGKFLASSLERQVYAQFREFIAATKGRYR